MSTSRLLEPIKIGNNTIKNRVVMAPLTRRRCDQKTGIPNEIVKEYYSQRASYGLQITESSHISHIGNSFPGAGGIHTEEQIQGWKKVTDAVHENKGVIFLQLYHGGRSVPQEYSGQQPIAPSPIQQQERPGYVKNEYSVPKEMSFEDIKQVQNEFKQAAINAKKAGFDGVQLHCSNGYLVDQFLRDGTNKREDKYGGSIENRCRFMLEIMDDFIGVFGNKGVAIRFSPTGRFGDMYDSQPQELMKYAMQELDKRDIAFVEVKRHGVIDSVQDQGEEVDYKGRVLSHLQIPDFFKTLRSYYKGVLIGNDGFDVESAEKALENNEIDMVSFGKLSICNPDLPERIQNEWEINTQIDWGNIHFNGRKGYSDYPFYNK